MIQFTAEFPKVEYAKQFAERIAQPGWRAEGIEQKSKVVTFQAPAGSEGPFVTFGDYLETVGYFGSTMSRKAKLTADIDGKVVFRTAPVAF